MSYCVNCGVELAASEPVCPLCGVEVQNPRAPFSPSAQRPYSSKVDKFIEQVDRKFGVWLASMFLLIPALCALTGNLLANRRISWSAYVMGACAILYIVVLFPLLFKKPKPYLFVLLDTASILLYLWLIDVFSGGPNYWFMSLGLPVTLIAALTSALALFMLRLRDYPNLYKTAAILSSVGIACVALDLVLCAFHGRALLPSWSLFVLGPCVVLSVMMIYVEKHKTLKDQIRRRLFY